MTKAMLLTMCQLNLWPEVLHIEKEEELEFVTQMMRRNNNLRIKIKSMFNFKLSKLQDQMLKLMESQSTFLPQELKTLLLQEPKKLERLMVFLHLQRKTQAQEDNTKSIS